MKVIKLTFIVMIALCMVACSDKKETISDKDSKSKEEKASWSKEARAQYMDQCVNQGGADPEVCKCVSDGLEKEYPNLPNMSEADLTPEKMDEFMKFGVNLSIECYEDLGIPVPPTFQMD